MNNLPLDVDFGGGIILKVVFKIIETTKEKLSKRRGGGSLQIKGGPSDMDWDNLEVAERATMKGEQARKDTGWDDD